MEERGAPAGLEEAIMRLRDGVAQAGRLERKHQYLEGSGPVVVERRDLMLALQAVDAYRGYISQIRALITANVSVIETLEEASGEWVDDTDWPKGVAGAS